MSVKHSLFKSKDLNSISEHRSKSKTQCAGNKDKWDLEAHGPVSLTYLVNSRPLTEPISNNRGKDT